MVSGVICSMGKGLKLTRLGLFVLLFWGRSSWFEKRFVYLWRIDVMRLYFRRVISWVASFISLLRDCKEV